MDEILFISLKSFEDASFLSITYLPTSFIPLPEKNRLISFFDFLSKSILSRAVFTLVSEANVILPTETKANTQAIRVNIIFFPVSLLID